MANLFVIFEPLAGKRQVKVTERRTKKDWAECVGEMADEMYPETERNATEAKVNWRVRTTDARIKLRKLYLSFDG